MGATDWMPWAALALSGLTLFRSTRKDWHEQDGASATETAVVAATVAETKRRLDAMDESIEELHRKASIEGARIQTKVGESEVALAVLKVRTVQTEKRVDSLQRFMWHRAYAEARVKHAVRSTEE